MESQSPHKKKYEAVLAEKARSPEMSFAALIDKHGAPKQGFWIYKRKWEAHRAAEARAKVPPKTAPKGPQAPPKAVDGDVIYIPVPKREIAEMEVRKRPEISIPRDKIFYALNDADLKEVRALMGEIIMEENSKKKPPEEVGLSGGGRGGKGGLLNKGGG
jgi:hypothetical protein